MLLKHLAFEAAADSPLDGSRQAEQQGPQREAAAIPKYRCTLRHMRPGFYVAMAETAILLRALWL